MALFMAIIKTAQICHVEKLESHICPQAMAQA